MDVSIFTACTELCKILFLAQSVCVFCLCMEYLGQPLNEFAPNSQGRRVWCLAWTNMKVRVKGQGHQGQKRHSSALSAACVRFIFLASSFL